MSRELLVRSLSGLVFVALVVGPILWNRYSVALIFLVVSFLGLLEFFKVMNAGGFRPPKVFGILCGVAIYCLVACSSLGLTAQGSLLMIFPILVSIVVVELFRNDANPISNISYTALSMLYVVCPLACLNYFAYEDAKYYEVLGLDGYQNCLLLGFFCVLWANDTGAYLFGRMLGRTKLFERISPNKTWEGAVGGAILAMLVGWLFGYLTESSVVHWMVISLIIVVFGTLGDLTESQIKRSVGIKDSGSIMPGHGGILDRFDGVLFAAPFVLTYLYLLSVNCSLIK